MSKVIDAKLKLKAIFSCPIRGKHYPCIVYKDVQWKFFLLKILCKCLYRFKASKIKFHEINWLQQREREMSGCILLGLTILLITNGNFWFKCVQFPNINLSLLGCKNLLYFSLALLTHAWVWLLFSGHFVLLFSLFYVIHEFDRFLHWGWARTAFSKAIFSWKHGNCWE